MHNVLRTVVLSVCLGLLPCGAHGERWVEFHAETWSQFSQKLKKNLQFSSHSYFDDDRIRRSADGEVTVWIRDVTHNDKFYVGKGIPEKEVVYKQVVLRCMSRRYAVILGENGDVEVQETASEEVRAGSAYDKLFNRLCTVSQ